MNRAKAKVMLEGVIAEYKDQPAVNQIHLELPGNYPVRNHHVEHGRFHYVDARHLTAIVLHWYLTSQPVGDVPVFDLCDAKAQMLELFDASLESLVWPHTKE